MADVRACWLTLKYSLAVLGGVLWVALWFERHPLAGLGQFLIIVRGAWGEIEARAATGRW
jgi:hypothetical protein